MFWGCINANGSGRLILVQGRMTAGSYTEILKDHVIELKNRFDNSVQWVYQQENAPCHKSRLATRFLADNNMRSLKWPPYSPDMNVIENVWAVLKSKIHTTCDELVNHVHQNYDNDIHEMCINIYSSLPRRVSALITAKGGYTGYELQLRQLTM